MGNQSNVKVALRLVSIVLLLSVAFVNSQCPAKCECDAIGFGVTCRNGNFVHLPKGPFHRKLKTMDISFNRIGILKQAMFADEEIYTLRNLTMSNNTITSLTEPFRGLSALEYLDLSNNDIETFNPSIFDDVQQLKTLVLHHNPSLELAELGYDLPELTDLILNNCRIKTVPPNFFNKLKNLENIDLSNNLIEHFDSKMISGLTSLKQIDWSSNKLSLLYEVVYLLPISLGSIRLSSNVWACNCDIKEAVALYEKISYEKSSILCSSPEDLINQTVNEELVKRITCTTSTEKTITESTTTEITVVDKMVQSDEGQDSDAEKLANIKDINSDKSGGMVQEFGELKSPSQSDKGNVIESDKGNDVQVVRAGWYTHWMIYGAVALVLTTSIVVFFVKYQVTKHMQRPGNIVDRSRQDLGLSRDGYHSVGVTAV